MKTRFSRERKTKKRTFTNLSIKTRTEITDYVPKCYLRGIWVTVKRLSSSSFTETRLNMFDFDCDLIVLIIIRGKNEIWGFIRPYL